jgi:hypothetical protein
MRISINAVSFTVLAGKYPCISEYRGSVDINDYTKSTDFGLVFGGGLDIAAGPGAVTLECRYVLGLTEIDDGFQEALEDPDPQKVDAKNHSIMILVGYSF